MKIKVNKKTPFNEKGDIISIKEFRLKYNYTCDQHVTDKELYEWIAHDTSIEEWFSAVLFEQKTPLTFMYRGIMISKQLDGRYHRFAPGAPIMLKHSQGSLSEEEATLLFRNEERKDLIYNCYTP